MICDIKSFKKAALKLIGFLIRLRGSLREKMELSGPLPFKYLNSWTSPL